MLYTYKAHNESTQYFVHIYTRFIVCTCEVVHMYNTDVHRTHTWVHVHKGYTSKAHYPTPMQQRKGSASQSSSRSAHVYKWAHFRLWVSCAPLCRDAGRHGMVHPHMHMQSTRVQEAQILSVLSVHRHRTHMICACTHSVHRRKLYAVYKHTGVIYMHTCCTHIRHIMRAHSTLFTYIRGL